jgi:hypothetical protein
MHQPGPERALQRYASPLAFSYVVCFRHGTTRMPALLPIRQKLPIVKSDSLD